MDPYKRITLVHAAFAFAVVLADPVFSLFLLTKGFDPVTLSILFSAFSLAAIITAPLIGGISDNWGRRPVILLGILFTMLGYALYFWAVDPLTLFLARILEGVGYSAVALVSIAKLEDLVAQQKNVNKSNVHARIGSSLSIGKLGHVLGPLIGGIIATYYGLGSPFLAAIVGLGIVGIWYFFQKHNYHPLPPLQKLTWNPIPFWKEYWKVKPLRGLIALVMPHQFSIAVIFAFLPLFLVENAHLSIEQVGIILFVKEIPQLMQQLAGKLTDQWGSKRVSIFGTTLSGIGMIGFAFAQTFEVILLTAFVYGLGASILGIGTLAMLSGIGEKQKREATYLGTHVSISKWGAFIAFLVAGVIVKTAGIPFLFAFSGTLLLIGVIIAEEKMGVHSFPMPKPRMLVNLLFHHR